MMVAGEASGDMYGGSLASALRSLDPAVVLFGVGGQRMREAGVETLVDNAGLAVVGLWEVISHFKFIRQAFKAMEKIIVNDPPNLLVLIDYPGFNIRLAQVAKRAGVPVVYYISPQIWAWRQSRIKTMAKTVDKMLVVFPFEESLYSEAGMDCSFVGHPLLDVSIESSADKVELAARFGLNPHSPILGILPGSRKKELAFHLPVMLAAFEHLNTKIPNLQGVIPVADTLALQDFQPYVETRKNIKLAAHDTGSVMALMDVAVVASGTATLQAALYKKPMVIIYKLSPITYFVGKRLIKVKNIGLVNLVAEREIVPELIQDKATPENISSMLFHYFDDEVYFRQIVAALENVKARLGGPGASVRAASEIMRFLS